MHFLAQGPIAWEPPTGREGKTAQTPEDSEDEKGEGHDNILLESLSAQVYNSHTHNFLFNGQCQAWFCFLSKETAMLR